MRTTYMEIDLNKFKSNIEKIKAFIGDKKIMPVIKANGYGTHINLNINAIKDFEIVAVAIAQEAVELRKIGYEGEIFILNQPYIDDLDDILNNNITIGISSKSFLEDILYIDKDIRVHLEIETGMNRTGIKIDELEDFIGRIKQNDHIKVEGIYAHLSSADIDEEYTLKQFDTFREAVGIVKNNFDSIKYIHSSASNGLLFYDDGVSNLTRPGIIMYGYESCEGVKDVIDVEPIAKLKSRVTFIKYVDEGDSVSYSRRFKAGRKTRVATIPIGYADGLRRELSNKGTAVINGKKAPIIGSVCMDSIMVDVTDIDDVKVGTEAFIWDNDIQKLEDISNSCNTINYEILSTISDRVPRVFIGE